jgi:hypothetical protein
MSNTPFSPLGATVTITTAAAASTTAQAIPGAGGDSALIYNPNAEVKFIRFGDSNVAAATTADTPVPATGYVTLGLPPGTTHCTVFGTTGAQLMYVARGAGM